jgi:hypothetical protein
MGISLPPDRVPRKRRRDSYAKQQAKIIGVGILALFLLVVLVGGAFNAGLLAVVGVVVGLAIGVVREVRKGW